MKSKICVVLFAVANFVRYYLSNVVDSREFKRKIHGILQECRWNREAIYIQRKGVIAR